jgi:hypothetical protein
MLIRRRCCSRFPMLIRRRCCSRFPPLHRLLLRRWQHPWLLYRYLSRRRNLARHSGLLYPLGFFSAAGSKETRYWLMSLRISLNLRSLLVLGLCLQLLLLFQSFPRLQGGFCRSLTLTREGRTSDRLRARHHGAADVWLDWLLKPQKFVQFTSRKESCVLWI